MPFSLRQVSIAAVIAALGSSATADVNAADVFSNQQAYLSALGMTLTGTADGEMLTGYSITASLPMGLGNLQITGTDIVMQDNGDGTVSISYPNGSEFSFSGFLIEFGAFSGTLRINSDSYTIEASGNPGDITYVTDAGEIALELVDFSSDAMDPSMTVAFRMVFDSWVAENRITEGNVLTLQSAGSIGDNRVELLIDDGTGLVVTTEQTTSATTTNSNLSLPNGGFNLLNISEAVRAGLSVDIQSQGGAVASETLTTMGGEVLSRQVNGNGEQTFNISLNESGLAMSGAVVDTTATFEDQMLFPMPFSIAIADVSFDILAPTIMSDVAQPFKLALSTEGVTLDDAIWSLIDPAAQLPRDPADIVMDFSGTGTFNFDPLDFMAYQTMDTPDATIDQVEINDFRLTAVGAEASAQGGFTFDWTDMFTIPGIARPEGEVTINVFGMNALLDTLVSMGLLSEDDLFGVRMMSGMFAEPTGDDALRSVIEINAEGHVIANGQRLR